MTLASFPSTHQRKCTKQRNQIKLRGVFTQWTGPLAAPIVVPNEVPHDTDNHAICTTVIIRVAVWFAWRPVAVVNCHQIGIW